MNIQLNQADIEAAIRSYVARMGISKTVDDIDFNVSRKGGTRIDAEITLSEGDDSALIAQATPDQRPEKFTAEPGQSHEAKLSDGQTNDTEMPEVADNDENEDISKNIFG